MKYTINQTITTKDYAGRDLKATVMKIRKYKHCVRYYCVSEYGTGFTLVDRG